MSNKSNAAVKPAASTAAPKAVEKPVIPAVDESKLPRYKYRGREFIDLRTMDGVCADRKAGSTTDHKYAKVHKAAVDAGSPCKLGWKYGTAILALGTNRNEKKPGTAHGIIQATVREAGDNGISGMELVPLVRVRAKTNTRSNFATGQTPPIGWAEGWIDSAVTQGILKVVKGKTLDLADETPPAAEAEKPAAKAA